MDEKQKRGQMRSKSERYLHELNELMKEFKGKPLGSYASNVARELKTLIKQL